MTQANTTLFVALDSADMVTVENYVVDDTFTQITPTRRRLDLSDETWIIVDDQPINLGEDEVGCALIEDIDGIAYSVRFFVTRSMELQHIPQPEVAHG